MKKGDYIVLWLHDKAAKLFLGLPEGGPIRRWNIYGTMADHEPVGIWVDVQGLEEREMPGNNIVQTWTVNPRVCLVRWDFVIHAIGKVSKKEPLGFNPAQTAYTHWNRTATRKSVSGPTLALPEQEYTPDDTLSEVPYVPLSLVSSTRL
jgi:hypothetical protein